MNRRAKATAPSPGGRGQVWEEGRIYKDRGKHADEGHSPSVHQDQVHFHCLPRNKAAIQGKGPQWKGLGDLDSHPGRAPPGATAWGDIGHVTVMDLTLAVLIPRVFWGSWRKNHGRLSGPLP